MEDGYKPSTEDQKRLNLSTKEIVSKKFLKLLKINIICSIFDCKQVSLVHAVYKKGRMTVMKNENNALIATEPIICLCMYSDYRKLNRAPVRTIVHFPSLIV